LATLPVPSLPYASARSSYTFKPMQLHELLTILRDGARAIRAFCRPYPVKVVGIPVDVQFDIDKASLKLKVRVTPGDAPQIVTVKEGEGEGLDKEGGDENMLPTEIFIPLVHFASDGCVEQSVAVWDREQLEDSEEVSEARSGGGSTVTLPLTMSKSLVAGEGETIETEGYVVLVKVSEGWAEMDESEQMLRWFYVVTVSGRKEVSIEVSKMGGGRGGIDWARVTRIRWRTGGKRCVVGCVERLC
jgi:hypothetical protein